MFVGGSLIVHKSKLQHITTLSAAEAELVALVLAICEAKWVCSMLWELVRVRGPVCAYMISTLRECIFGSTLWFGEVVWSLAPHSK